ncbi:MAG: DUF1302 family protein [Desulfobacterales bacterium]
MKKKFGVIFPLLFLALVAWTAEPVHAVFLNAERTIELKGKLQSRVSVSTEDTEGFSSIGEIEPLDPNFGGVTTDGFTFPDVDAWELVQHRNIAYVEFNHDLGELGRTGVDFKYHLLGRFLYEGIYDYGPEEYQDAAEVESDEFDDIAEDADLWEAYADISRGPLFVRIGRQTLAWGETDIFRLLDNINPLDNTYGFIFEDLDDRRIPLDMIRASYNIGRVGIIRNFGLEGFWSPGFLEDTVAPFAPRGSRYAYPLGLTNQGPNFTGGFILPMLNWGGVAGWPEVVKPDEDMINSRFGIRHIGFLGTNINYTIAHMRSILDVPGIGGVFTGPDEAGNNYWGLRLYYDTVDITGLSVNFYEPVTDIVFRAEVAYFWNEAVLNTETAFAPLAVVLNPESGLDENDLVFSDVQEKEFWKFMLGLDKNLWVRWLNRNQTFYLSAQYFGAYMVDHEETIIQPVNNIPSKYWRGDAFPKVSEYEHTVTFIANTAYYSGRIEPQIALAVDLRGAWFIQPQVNYMFDPWRLKLQYSGISGNRTSFGLLRDRDQLSLILTYNF